MAIDTQTRTRPTVSPLQMFGISLGGASTTFLAADGEWRSAGLAVVVAVVFAAVGQAGQRWGRGRK